MYPLQATILGAIAAWVVAHPTTTSVLHESRDYVPRGWIKQSRVDANIELPIRIGMVQSNLDKGHDLLMEVSNPTSPRYGQHYTPEEVADIFAPLDSTFDSLRSWLSSTGIPAHKLSQSFNKQWIQFDILASELESLLETEYHVYEHAETGRRTVSCERYHIPAHIRHHIDYITPGIKLFSEKKRASSEQGLEKRMFSVTLEALLTNPELLACDRVITPACIRALYNVSMCTTAASGNQLGIFEDLGDVYSQTDLDLFFGLFAHNVPIGTSPKLEAIDGAVAPNSVQNAGGESDLDFQVSYPLIYPQGAILFQTNDPVYEANYVYTSFHNGFLNTFLDALDGSYCSVIEPQDPSYPNPSTQAGAYKGKLQCGVYKPTNVISISYGGSEGDLPAAYQQRQCNEFMKLGMQGVSVVVASGDSGVAGIAGNAGNLNGCLGSGQIFNPEFPATCPYITVVGATYLPSGANVRTDAEVAVTRFGSGGGFSNIYPIPSYQSSAVNGYLKNSPPPYASYSGTNIGANGGIFNNAGRAYPDVSAVGDKIIIFNKGSAMLKGGTSASTPIFASLLTRINEERIAAGKSTVGFVNPTLYSNPQAFHDITTGNNPGCGSNGFSAAKGWDPVTGLGTPDYPILLSVFMNL